MDPEYITLIDESRDNREVECKIYNGGETPIIFSHGLGGSKDGYEYLAQYWAENGFFVIHPNHVGTDSALLEMERPFKALKEAANDPQQLHDRPQDIIFVLNWLEEQDEFDIDTSKIGLAGHSFGAFTTLATIGQAHSNKGELRYKDERVTAAIAISPSAPRENQEAAFANIDIPIFHITGKKDDSPVGLTNPEDRKLPYKLMNNSDQYLTVFENADHMIFASQRRRNIFSDEDNNIMHSTKEIGLEFWKKYLSEGESAIDTDEFYANLPAQNLTERK